MAKKSEPSSNPTEEESPENSSTGEDDDGNSDTDGDDYSSDPKEKGAILSEYEKQRLSRIADNKARMDALGLNKIASSLKSNNNNKISVSNRKGKRKVGEDDDDEYMPNDDHGDGAEEDDDDNFCIETYRNQKVNKKSLKGKKAVVQKQLSSSDLKDGGDEELMQAIALSLQDSPNGGASKRKGKTSAFNDKRSNRKKPFASRVQMTEDDVILHYFQFDETGKGNITVRDLERVSIANDFIWTEEELADMISCFDIDRDGKLNLSDFQKIVGRLNMVRGSDNS